VPISVARCYVPSNTMWPGPRHTSVPSGILVHPTVSPQYTNVTDTQTDRQQSDRGRTVCGRPFVVRLMLSDRHPVLSVMLVYCGQTVGRIKMTSGMWVGQGPGHIVLDGDPAPLPKRGTAPNFLPISVVAKWLDGSRCHLVGRHALAQATLC